MEHIRAGSLAGPLSLYELSETLPFVTKRLLILAATAVCVAAPVGTGAEAESADIAPQISRTVVTNELHTSGASGPDDNRTEFHIDAAVLLSIPPTR